MLLVLMYHRAGPGPLGNPVSVLRSHFEWLAPRFPVVLPGGPLPAGRLSLCLTFDDAYADFHAHVFPLLREMGLKAVLAIPTAFILPDTDCPLAKRLAVSPEEAMQADTWKNQAPFCTWEELREMAHSGLVELASHSHSHLDMSRPEADPAIEAGRSKTLIEERVGRPVRTFVYPFGKVNAAAHRAVSARYSYAMRIGSALNSGWSQGGHPISRVGADDTPALSALFRPMLLAQYGLKWIGNSLRAAGGKWG